MPHREATNYFQRKYQAVAHYRKYGCDEAEVERKIRDGEIVIGEPPEKLGAIRRAPGGHFHYEYPDVPAPDKTEAQLRAEHKGLPRFKKIDDEWGDDEDPAVIGKSKLQGAKGVKPDSDVQAVLRKCRLEGLKLYVPPERLDPKHFAKVKKEIVTWGGKWSTPKQCFVFTKDPAEKIAHFLDTGEIINEKKDRQAFYTPDTVVETMLEQACLDEYSEVLEPSAGNGAIARACTKAGAGRVVCCEIDPHECAALRAEGIYAEVHEGDFLQMKFGREFNVIVMNPPFAGGQDSRHVLHAHKFLRRDGRLLAIVADKDDPKLAHLKPEVIERIPAGAFRESGTNVATRLIQILS